MIYTGIRNNKVNKKTVIVVTHNEEIVKKQNRKLKYKKS